MKKLIILTGISGVGKTTLANYIQSKIQNVTVITVDTILEGICEMIGFHDKKEKKRNRTIALNCFKKILEECMKREDKIIVVDYPFKSIWKDFFDKISGKYDYDVLTVKLYGETFEQVYERACARDLSEERNIIHECDTYFPNREGNAIRRKVQSEDVLRKIYESEARTDFIVGKELKLVNKDKESLEECFTKIERWVLKEGEKTI